MERDPPEPQPFDPAHSEAPTLTDTVGGGVVVLVAVSGAADIEWAERAATALATAWARGGRRILLADLALVRPGLHRHLGVENREGVSDTFLFGSSIQRVARPVRERGFLFVPAGTATARPAAVASSPRWRSVLDGCARAQATLVVFLPSDLPGSETLLERASDVVVLTDASAAATGAFAGWGNRLRAVLVPPHGEAGAPVAENGAAPGLAPEPAAGTPVSSLAEGRSELDAWDAELASPIVSEPDLSLAVGDQPIGDAPVLPTEAAPTEGPKDLDFDFEFGPLVASSPEDISGIGPGLSLVEPDLEPVRESEPVPEPKASPAAAPSSWATPGSAVGATLAVGSDLRAGDLPTRYPASAGARERPREVERPDEPLPRKKPSRAGALMLLILVVLAAVVAAAWYGLIDIPWLRELLPATSAAATVMTASADAPAAPQPASAPVDEFAYALTLDSFTDPAPPRLQAASLNEQRPDLLFVVTPVSVDGNVYYRLLAGPAADSAGAEALRATLQSVLTRENPAQWVLRPTPLAFNLGDRDDLAAAAARVDELSRVDIPAYVLELPGRTSDGVRTPRYRVYGGAFADEQESAYLRDLLVSKGYPDARLVQRIGRHPQ